MMASSYVPPHTAENMARLAERLMTLRASIANARFRVSLLPVAKTAAEGIANGIVGFEELDKIFDAADAYDDARSGQ